MSEKTLRELLDEFATADFGDWEAERHIFVLFSALVSEHEALAARVEALEKLSAPQPDRSGQKCGQCARLIPPDSGTGFSPGLIGRCPEWHYIVRANFDGPGCSKFKRVEAGDASG